MVRPQYVYFESEAQELYQLGVFSLNYVLPIKQYLGIRVRICILEQQSNREIQPDELLESVTSKVISGRVAFGEGCRKSGKLTLLPIMLAASSPSKTVRETD
jgi:hypothetical protein